MLHDELSDSYEVLKGIRDPRSSYGICSKLAIIGPIRLDHLLHVPPGVGPHEAVLSKLQTSPGKPHGFAIRPSPPTGPEHIETKDPEPNDAPVEITAEERLDPPIPEQVAGFEDRPGGGVSSGVSRTGHEYIVGHLREEL